MQAKVTNHIRLNVIIQKQLAHYLGMRVPEAELLSRQSTRKKKAPATTFSYLAHPVTSKDLFSMLWFV
jgi:hypothetical protein